MARTALCPDKPAAPKKVIRFGVDIDPNIRDRFKSACSLRGRNIVDRISEMMTAEADAAGIPPTVTT